MRTRDRDQIIDAEIRLARLYERLDLVAVCWAMGKNLESVEERAAMIEESEGLTRREANCEALRRASITMRDMTPEAYDLAAKSALYSYAKKYGRDGLAQFTASILENKHDALADLLEEEFIP